MHLITTKRGISKTVMIERLFADFDIDTTPRTLERDLKNLKDDFGIEINYSRAIRGYVLEEDDLRISQFLKFAEFSSLAEVYEEGIKDYKSFNKYVIPDDSSGFVGLHNMARIIKGITLSRKLTFTKENYYKGTKKLYTVTPMRLKEYLKRWYLIAVPEGENEIRNFGIDRISDLKLTDYPSDSSKDFETQIKLYEDIVGLNYNESEKVEKVILKADNKQLKYLRSLPLHKSQVCADGLDGEWGKAIFHIKPNYEFETQILKMAGMVAVEEPKWLRKKIKNHIKEMMDRYE
jgi:predicted DNA-binding transcriptional regulator YafY